MDKRVWIVMCHEPFEDSYYTYVCGTEETAKFLLDWCMADEYNRIHDARIRNKWPDHYTPAHTHFSIEIEEVIL